MSIRTTWLVAAVIGIAGCATPPPPVRLAKTTVVLMPDEDGTVGTVSVTNATGSQTVDRAYGYTTVEGGSRPSGVLNLDSGRVDETYRALLAAQPPAPKSFMLHFHLDKTLLTEESKAQLPAVLKAIRERKPTEITIFGHADSSGSDKYNLKLSAERARAIAGLLKKADPDLDRIDVQFFGEKVPLISSDPRAPEPRNRRAEIMIL